MHVISVILIAVITFVASLVSTVVGFGIGTMLLPGLILLIPVHEALLFIVIIHTVHDIWKIVLFYRGISWSLIKKIGIPAIIGSAVGAILVLHIDPLWIKKLIGLFLVGYGCISLLHPHFRIAASRITSTIGGFVAGFSAGLFGMRGALLSAILSAFHVPKETYVATIGALNIIINITCFLIYTIIGGIILKFSQFSALLLSVPLSFLGAYCAKCVLRILSYSRFRAVVMIFLLLVGIRLMYWD